MRLTIRKKNKQLSYRLDGEKGNTPMINILPTFEGYTVDIRLKEFRKADPQQELEFIPFDSPQGDRLLEGFIETINADTNEGRKLLIDIWG